MSFSDEETDKIIKQNRLENMGKRIHSIRINLGLTMSEFASKIDDRAKSGTVSNWEHGKNAPNNARLKKIAQLGNTSVSELKLGISQENLEKGLKQMQAISSEMNDFYRSKLENALNRINLNSKNIAYMWLITYAVKNANLLLSKKNDEALDIYSALTQSINSRINGKIFDTDETLEKEFSNLLASIKDN